MAKKSIINRELKRTRTVAKYAAKRAELKAQLKDDSLSAEDRAEAHLRLRRLFPRAAPDYAPAPCAGEWCIPTITKRWRDCFRRFPAPVAGTSRHDVGATEDFLCLQCLPRTQDTPDEYPDVR